MASQVNTATYFDEEDCLGLEVFLAELELVVGARRDKFDQVALLELLPKLAATIAKTDRATLKQHQRRCEAAFQELLHQGMSMPIVRLIGICLHKFYTQGDSISIYAFVNDLQKCLNIKDPLFKAMPEMARPGLLDLLAELSLHHGRYLASAAAESCALAKALMARSASPAPVKAAALRLAAAVVEGLNPMDRGAPAVQAEAWTMFGKAMKERGSEEVRAAAACVVSGLARGGCAVLWADGAYNFDQAVRACSAALLDDGTTVALCEAFAQALADLALAVRRDGYSLALRDEKKAPKKTALEALGGRGALAGCLSMPLVQAAVLGRREACAALAVAWTTYIGALEQAGEKGASGASSAGSGPSASPQSVTVPSLTDELVELAVQVVLLGDAASQASKSSSMAAHTSPHTFDPIGAALASGEMPVLSSCLLYVLKAGVVEALPEAGQKVLLARLVALLGRPSTSPPAAVVALEGLSMLLSALGEVSDEESDPLQACILAQLSCPSAAVRQQAAQALASLVMAQPSSCAKLLSAAMAALEGASRRVAGVPPNTELPCYLGPDATLSTLSTHMAPFLGPAAKAGDVSRGTEQVLIAYAHGCALAVAALLVAASRLPLSCPALVWEQAAALASRLVQQPYSKTPKTRALEREAGYLVVGALCRGGLPEGGQLAGRAGHMLSLIEVALGDDAKAALDQRSVEKAGGDMELAMELWWRAGALQALATLLEVAVLGGLLGKQRMEQQVSLVVDLLTPLLTVIESQQLLLDASASRGLLSACVATFQMRLLRVYLVLPGGWPLTHAHNQLLRLCIRPLAGAYPMPGTAEALYRTALRQCLPKEDVALGPWPPGRDTAQDELRVFAGEPGGPHHQLWESTPLSALARSAQPSSSSSPLLSGSAFRLGRSGANSPSAASVMSLSPNPSFAPSASGTLSIPSPHTLHTSPSGGGGSSGGAGSPGGSRNATLPRPGLSSLPRPHSLTHQQRAHTSRSSPGSTGRRQGGGTGRGQGLSSCLYPQPLGLGAALLATQLALLGRLLSRANLPTQLQILEVLIKCAGANRGASLSTAVTSRERDAASVRHACCITAAVAGLGGLLPILRKSAGKGQVVDATDKLPERVLSLANTILDDNTYDTALSRACALLLAASAALGSEAWCSRLQRSLAAEVAASAREGRDADRRGVLCLALGCLHRLRGGLTMQSALPSTTEALSLAASRPSRSGPPAALWALHALALVASYAGPAYMPHVRKTLRLCQELLVSGADPPGLHPACASLANSMVAVLGPEFTLGSMVYRMARSIITGEMDAAGGVADPDAPSPPNPATSSGVGAGAGAGAGASSLLQLAVGSGGGLLPSGPGGAGGNEEQQAVLQAVLLVQQLILFAPHTVRARRHVPLLRAALLSKRPALRRAAASTLRQLAGRDAALLLPEGLEPALFVALDCETDPAVAEQLEGTLDALLQAGAPHDPLRWRELLSQVAFAAPSSSSSTLPGAAPGAAGGAGAAGRGGDEDDEDDGGDGVVVTRPAAGGKVPPGAVAANGNGAATGGGVSTLPASGAGGGLQSVAALLSSWLRLRTRTFAAELLGRMVAVMRVAPDAGPAMAEHLQVLVDIGFRLATGGVEALKPWGVALLQQVVVTFGKLEDPLLPGALLLEQYQAQLVSTLRAALQPGVTPSLAIAGGALASVFLKSGVAAGDPVVMQRLMDLLTAPLSDWQSLSYEQYGEWVTVRARVALLQAHAQCASIRHRHSSPSQQGQGGRQGTTGGAAGQAAAGLAAAAEVVAKAQRPYLSMLRALWYSLLQDHTLLETQHPVILAAYASELFPPLPASSPHTPATSSNALAPGAGAGADVGGTGAGAQGGVTACVAMAVRGAYCEAVPSVLTALADSFPSAETLEQGGPELQRFVRLLESALMVASRAGAEIEEQLRSGRPAALAAAAAALSHASPHAQPHPERGAHGGGGNGGGGDLPGCCARLAAALHCLAAALSPGVLASPELWQDVGPACVDAAHTLSALATGALAQLAWAACKEAQDSSEPPAANPSSSRGPSTVASVVSEGLFAPPMASSSGSIAASLLMPSLVAASSLALQLSSGLPPERLLDTHGPPSAAAAAAANGEAAAAAGDVHTHVHTRAQLLEAVRGGLAPEPRPALALLLAECLVALSSLASPFALVTPAAAAAAAAAAGEEGGVNAASNPQPPQPSAAPSRSSSLAGGPAPSAGAGATAAAQSLLGAVALGGEEQALPLPLLLPLGAAASPSGGSGGDARQRDAALSSLHQGAISLLQRTPAGPLLSMQVAPALLTLAARQLLTAAPGPQLSSALGFCDAAVGALAERAADDADISSAGLGRYGLSRQESLSRGGMAGGVLGGGGGGGLVEGGAEGRQPLEAAAALLTLLTQAAMRVAAAPAGVAPGGAEGNAAATVTAATDLVAGSGSRLGALLSASLGTAAQLQQFQEHARKPAAAAAQQAQRQLMQALLALLQPSSPSTSSSASPPPALTAGEASAQEQGQQGSGANVGAGGAAAGGAATPSLQLQVLEVLRARLQECTSSTTSTSSTSTATTASTTSPDGSSAGWRKEWGLELVSTLGPAVATLTRQAIRDASTFASMPPPAPSPSGLQGSPTTAPDGEGASAASAAAAAGVGPAAAAAAAGQQGSAAATAAAGAAAAVAGLQGSAVRAVACEGIRVLLSAASLSPGLTERVLRVLVPLLVEAAAPVPPGAPDPVLRDMAIRLVTSLPASPTAGAAFKTVVAALPAQLKARLQAALRESAAAAAAAPASSAVAGGGAVPGAAVAPRAPTIQLKSTFALPLPKK